MASGGSLNIFYRKIYQVILHCKVTLLKFTTQLLVLCVGHESLFSEDRVFLCFGRGQEGLPAVVKLLLKLLTRLQELQGKVSHLWYLLVLCFGKEKLQLLFPANLERASFASGYHFQFLYLSLSFSLCKWEKIDETVDKAGNWQRQMSNYEEGSCWEIKWKDGECRNKSFSPDNGRTPSQEGETHQEKETQPRNRNKPRKGNHHGKETHQGKETHKEKETSFLFQIHKCFFVSLHIEYGGAWYDSSPGTRANEYLQIGVISCTQGGQLPNFNVFIFWDFSIL